MSVEDLRLDAIADEFEGEWQDGGQPDLKQYLDRVEQRLRSRLGGYLIPIDIEYRKKAGQSPQTADIRETTS